MTLRPVFYVIGVFLCVLAAFMIVPMLVDLYYNHIDWQSFAVSMVITGFIGGLLVLSNSHEKFHLNVHQTFLLTTSSWVALGLAGALPLILSAEDLSLTDAVFESISGITTTGSTILTNIESMPPGVLIWRAILQWLGGIGIIVMALSVLPFLKVGGMQLFKTESSENEKIMPRATQLSASITIIYLCLTMLCFLGYKIAGMGSFDAWAHAMTTIATGGFSTFDTSFGHYDAPWIEVNAILFMIIGSLPFILYIKLLGGNWKALFRDSQVQVFIKLVLMAIMIMTIYQTWHNNIAFDESLRRAGFNVVSIITGTGYANGNYNDWGGFAVSLMFFLMIIGGCAGSTTCGIKIFRFQVLFEVTSVQLKQLLYPHGVFTPHYNHQAIPRGVVHSVFAFFFVYLLFFFMIAVALSFLGLDFLTAMSASLTSISNVGPGLGDMIGPSGTFAQLPGAAKWVLCFGMILGRLELFTVLVLFIPGFWRR